MKLPQTPPSIAVAQDRKPLVLRTLAALGHRSGQGGSRLRSRGTHRASVLGRGRAWAFAGPRSRPDFQPPYFFFPSFPKLEVIKADVPAFSFSAIEKERQPSARPCRCTCESSPKKRKPSKKSQKNQPTPYPNGLVGHIANSPTGFPTGAFPLKSVDAGRPLPAAGRR